MFSYLSIAVIIFFALMFGILNNCRANHRGPTSRFRWGCWLPPVLWFASKAGQKLAQVEMEQCDSLIENAWRPVSDKWTRK